MSSVVCLQKAELANLKFLIACIVLCDSFGPIKLDAAMPIPIRAKNSNRV